MQVERRLSRIFLIGMNRLIVIGVVLLVFLIIGVIVEAFAYYGAKKDQEKFSKLSPDEKWKLQQEARKDHLLR